ncbi:MAG: hypothetical protein HN390_09020 [Anaerolineae bacterium]|jgi:hypothetical protein|nr:hypothetical protein [Anaerolineae bacterium]MBT7189803.1 hypothetical protein [Anaerolineae bacterium]MBT7988697.1 hypothetical protein [Anaerolineae bacterium]
MNFKKRSLFEYALLLQAFASGLALTVYAYIGTFTRLLADDYYHIYLTRSADGLLATSIEKYLEISNRYSNLLLFALGDQLGQQWLPTLMIFLWLLGLLWLFIELNKRAKSQLPHLMLLAIASLLVFLSILQAPNLYQTIYWLSGMTAYFAPLVFFPFLLVGIFAFLRKSRPKVALFGMALFNTLIAFLIGGLSETVGAMHISILALILITFWIWGTKEQRISASVLLGSTMLGGLLSLATMALSPANTIRSSAPPLPIPVFIERLFIFPYGFITDTFKTLPLPTLFTVLVAFLIFNNLPSHLKDRKLISYSLALAPIITFALIAASFAPSAYALSYPDARVRFPARFIMTSGLFIEGALLGMLFAREKFRTLSTLFLVAAAIYPLRGAWQAYQSLPKYQAYANAWDTRDAYIQSKRDSGIMDIAVPPMDGMAGIKEFDIDPNHWVNRGAADYYGVDAISVHSTSLDYDE